MCGLWLTRISTTESEIFNQVWYHLANISKHVRFIRHIPFHVYWTCESKTKLHSSLGSVFVDLLSVSPNKHQHFGLILNSHWVNGLTQQLNLSAPKRKYFLWHPGYETLDCRIYFLMTLYLLKSILRNGRQASTYLALLMTKLPLNALP